MENNIIRNYKMSNFALPTVDEYGNKDFRQNWEDEYIWDYVYIDQLNIDEIRQFIDFIKWQNQVYLLRKMFNRWNEQDQKFWREFYDHGIFWCELKWGEFKKGEIYP